MAAVTYPGTVTPLRGLSAFTESERDVLFGRDRESEELTRLITGESFRAGLLHGEPGVGKTSLLRAGLVPHLRDHGVIALVCENPYAPIDSFGHALTLSGGAQPAENEPNLAFLSRVVGGSMAGQLYLFVVDEAQIVLETEDVVGQLGDLFARVVARSGGRARFLFSCGSEKVHLFSNLEKRTGSLFPPSSRFELTRFSPGEAATVLERTLALAGVKADASLAQAVAKTFGQTGPVLPADLQITALAIRELGLTNADELARMGGPSELEREWLTRAALATGNARSGLRLIAELAHGDGSSAVPADWAAARASLDPKFARSGLATLQQRGIVEAIAVHGTEEFHYRLAHSILAPRVREIAAPARVSARRAFELLGSKAAQNKRLTAREWWQVQREGITPSTAPEKAVLDRTIRLAKIIGAAAVGVPILLLIIIYVAMSGSFYLDVARTRGGAETVVVRAGSPGLSMFHWLPASPSFGSIIADTGYRETMLADGKWGEIADHDITGDGGGYVKAAARALDPQLANLIEYATDGSESALDAMVKQAEQPAQLAALLESLRPIARGGPQEVALVESALLDPSPSVQSAALALAAATVQRRPNVYDSTLARSLTSADQELRRLTFTVVRSLGPDVASALFRAAAQDAEGEARRELDAVVTMSSSDRAAIADAAVTVLSNRAASPPARESARDLLRRAFRTDPASASVAAAKLLPDDKPLLEDKKLAFDLLLAYAPEETYPTITDALRSVMRANDEKLRAAGLPLYARVSPETAAGDLALLLENTSLSDELRAAMALAWGELARGGNRTAAGALETLVKDRRPAVRAAAARAYGYVGRSAQDELIKIVKKERYDVAVGAAYGLANSATAGGSAGNAAYGIAQLWKKKGRARRDAGKIYAEMARRSPGVVFNYLAAATRATDDSELHPIGVDGVCNALKAGYKSAPSQLARSIGDPAVEVRRKVIECAADTPKQKATAIRIATAMVSDRDAAIRTEVATVLATIAAAGDPPQKVKKGLVELATDDLRDVRVIAVQALAALGAGAPENAAEVLPRIFRIADEAEKLVVLKTAQALRAGGLVPLALADESVLVREAGLDTAIATGSSVATTLNSALSDPSPALRRAAINRLERSDHGLGPEEVDRALGLAIRDRDETIRDQALKTLARLGELDQVKARLQTALRSRSERQRARAAAALTGLAERKPKDAIALLEPLLDDSSHDVRAAMLPSLAAAYAIERPKDLAAMLRKSEKHATKRLVVTAAFLVLARTEGGKEAATAALDDIAGKGPHLVRDAASLGLGLIAAEADGVQFLASLVP